MIPDILEKGGEGLYPGDSVKTCRTRPEVGPSACLAPELFSMRYSTAGKIPKARTRQVFLPGTSGEGGRCSSRASVIFFTAVSSFSFFDPASPLKTRVCEGLA